MLPDQVLQQQLLRPTGTVPSYLVMSELQRRKEMRNEYQSRPGPQRSMVEEYAQGMDSGPPQGPGGGLAQLLANPPPGGQQGGQPGQGQVGPSGLGLAPQPPQGMMPPQQQPMEFADGGDVSALRNLWLMSRGYTTDPSGAGGGRVSDAYNDAANEGLIGYAPNQGDGIGGVAIDPIMWRQRINDAIRRNRTSNPFSPGEDDFNKGYGPSGISPDHRFIAPGYGDGGEVLRRMQRQALNKYMPYVPPVPFDGGEFGVAPNQQYVDRSTPAFPQLERMRQMIAQAQSRIGSEPNNPGLVPGGNPIIAPPSLAPQMVPEGPPNPPDTRTMLQRFQGAMANQGPDASVMAADVIRSIPPIDWQSIGTGPEAQAQAQRYAEVLRTSEDRPSWFQRDPGTSLGETISRRIRGVPGSIPRQGPGGVQDYPPDVVADPFAKLDPSSFGNAGETGTSPTGERPRLELGGEPPEWLIQSPFSAALRTPIEGSNTAEFGGDRPPTGRPAVPHGGGPGVTRGLPPPGGGGGPTVNSGPPGGGPTPQGGMLANQGLDDIMAGMTQARGPDRYADLVAQNQQAKADLLAGRDADRGMALLTAGLGMMAGQSPNAWTNIGQGALLGVRNWENASKEMRMAERDLRNADQAIAIAQANRDERAVEMAFKQKAMAEEALLRREALAAQREATASARADALDVRRSAATDAAQNRTDMLALRRMEIEDNSKTRGESREQNRIAELGTAAKIANGQADQIETKILAITSNVGNNTSDPAIKAQIEALTRQAQERRAEVHRRERDKVWSIGSD